MTFVPFRTLTEFAPSFVTYMSPFSGSYVGDSGLMPTDTLASMRVPLRTLTVLLAQFGTYMQPFEGS